MRGRSLPWKRAVGVGLGTWFLAFGLGPLLHLIEHERAHVHLPDGGILFVDHAGDRPTAPSSGSDDGPEHGRGGSSHFGAASISTPAPFVVASGLWCQFAELAPSDPSSPRLPGWTTPRSARGPPIPLS